MGLIEVWVLLFDISIFGMLFDVIYIGVFVDVCVILDCVGLLCIVIDSILGCFFDLNLIVNVLLWIFVWGCGFDVELGG